MKSYNLPFVSVIIPVYNEAKYIGYCLESLKNLNYPDERYEIILVDNGSTDDTVLISKRFTENVYVISDVNVSALRNYGVRKAKGEIYAFIDADCVANKNWLQNAVISLTKEPCVTGSKCDIPSNATWIEKSWFSQKPTGRRESTYINSGNIIVPAGIFNKVGGFNELLSTGEDSEFCLRAKDKTKVISDDTVSVVHLGNPKTLQQFLKREIWHGLGSLGSFNYRWFDKPLIGTIVFSLLTLFQILGIIKLVIVGGRDLIIYSSAIIAILLSGTVLYRMKYISSPLQVLQLLILYYLFYTGRSISLFYLITKRNYLRIK